MLKLNASFSKKVPAETDYSSKSYHASVEVELPDGLNDAQLKERIHSTFELVRASVETEIGTHSQAQPPQQPPANNAPRGNGNAGNGFRQGGQTHSDPASAKQLKYLLDLGRQCGLMPAELAAKAGAQSIDSLTRQQCSKLIDELGRKAA